MSIATGIAQCQAENDDGRVQLCWISGQQAKMKYEIDLLGNYSGEMNLGPAGYLLDANKPMTMGRNGQGRLVVMAHSTIGGRVAISQVTANGSWGSWNPFP